MTSERGLRRCLCELCPSEDQVRRDVLLASFAIQLLGLGLPLLVAGVRLLLRLLLRLLPLPLLRPLKLLHRLPLHPSPQ